MQSRRPTPALLAVATLACCSLAASCRMTGGHDPSSHDYVLLYDGGALAACGKSSPRWAVGEWRVFYENGDPMLSVNFDDEGSVQGLAIWWDRNGNVVQSRMKCDVHCDGHALGMTFSAPWQIGDSLTDLGLFDGDRAARACVAVNNCFLGWQGSGNYVEGGLQGPAEPQQVVVALREMQEASMAHRREPDHSASLK